MNKLALQHNKMAISGTARLAQKKLERLKRMPPSSPGAQRLALQIKRMVARPGVKKKLEEGGVDIPQRVEKAKPQYIKTESYKRARREEAIVRAAKEGLEKPGITETQKAQLEGAIQRVKRERLGREIKAAKEKKEELYVGFGEKADVEKAILKTKLTRDITYSKALYRTIRSEQQAKEETKQERTVVYDQPIPPRKGGVWPQEGRTPTVGEALQMGKEGFVPEKAVVSSILKPQPRFYRTTTYPEFKPTRTRRETVSGRLQIDTLKEIKEKVYPEYRPTVMGVTRAPHKIEYGLTETMISTYPQFRASRGYRRETVSADVTPTVTETFPPPKNIPFPQIGKRLKQGVIDYKETIPLPIKGMAAIISGADYLATYGLRKKVYPHALKRSEKLISEGQKAWQEKKVVRGAVQVGAGAAAYMVMRHPISTATTIGVWGAAERFAATGIFKGASYLSRWSAVGRYLTRTKTGQKIVVGGVRYGGIGGFTAYESAKQPTPQAAVGTALATVGTIYVAGKALKLVGPTIQKLTTTRVMKLKEWTVSSKEPGFGVMKLESVGRTGLLRTPIKEKVLMGQVEDPRARITPLMMRKITYGRIPLTTTEVKPIVKKDYFTTYMEVEEKSPEMEELLNVPGGGWRFSNEAYSITRESIQQVGTIGSVRYGMISKRSIAANIRRFTVIQTFTHVPPDVIRRGRVVQTKAKYHGYEVGRVEPKGMAYKGKIVGPHSEYLHTELVTHDVLREPSIFHKQVIEGYIYPLGEINEPYAYVLTKEGAAVYEYGAGAKKGEVVLHDPYLYGYKGRVEYVFYEDVKSGIKQEVKKRTFLEGEMIIRERPALFEKMVIDARNLAKKGQLRFTQKKVLEEKRKVSIPRAERVQELELPRELRLPRAATYKMRTSPISSQISIKRQVSKGEQSIRQKPIMIQLSIPRTEEILRQQQVPRAEQVPRTAQIQRQTQIQRQKQIARQQQIQRQTYYGKTVRTTPPRTTILAAPPFGIPKKYEERKKKRIKFYGFEQPLAYRTTLFARAYGIKGKPTRLGIKTGLGVRPI